MSEPTHLDNKNEQKDSPSNTDLCFVFGEKTVVLQIYKNEMLNALNFNLISTNSEINKKLAELADISKPYKEKLAHSKTIQEAMEVLKPIAEYLTENNTVSQNKDLKELFKTEDILKKPLNIYSTIKSLSLTNSKVQQHIKPLLISLAIPLQYKDINAISKLIKDNEDSKLDMTSLIEASPEELLSRNKNWRDEDKYPEFKKKTIQLLTKFGFNAFSDNSTIGFYRPPLDMIGAYQRSLYEYMEKSAKLLFIKNEAVGFNGHLNLAFNTENKNAGSYSHPIKTFNISMMRIFKTAESQSTIIHEWAHALDNKVNTNAIQEEIRKNKTELDQYNNYSYSFSSTSPHVYGLNINDPAYQARMALKEILSAIKYDNKDEIYKIKNQQKQDLHEVIFSLIIDNHQNLSSVSKTKLQSNEISFAMENFINAAPIGQTNLLTKENFGKLEIILKDKIPEIQINKNSEATILAFAQVISFINKNNLDNPYLKNNTSLSTKTMLENEILLTKNRRISHGDDKMFDEPKNPTANIVVDIIKKLHLNELNEYAIDKINTFVEQQESTKQQLSEVMINSKTYNVSIKKDSENKLDYLSQDEEMFARQVESHIFNTKTKTTRNMLMLMKVLSIDEKHTNSKKDLDIYHIPGIKEHIDFKICFEHCIANTLGKDSLAENAQFHKNPNAFHERNTQNKSNYSFMINSAKMMQTISKTINQQTTETVNSFIESKEKIIKKFDNFVDKVCNLIQKNNTSMKSLNLGDSREDFVSAMKEQVAISLKDNLTDSNTLHTQLLEKKEPDISIQDIALSDKFNKIRIHEVNDILVSSHIAYKPK